MDSIPTDVLSVSEILQKISETPNPTQNIELIEIVCEYLKYHKQDFTRVDAIRWISSMKQNNSFIAEKESEKFIQENSSLVLRSKKEIENLGLIQYIEKFAIPIDLAKKYLQELKVHQLEINKDFYVLGFKNEDDGFEIRSPFIKGCVGLKNITFIRGLKEKPESIHIFKSFWDYLSLLSHLSTRSLNVDCIVLNSFSCLRQAFPYVSISNYKTVYTWMDNYAIGNQATCLLEGFFKTQNDLKHIPMNKVYSPNVDVSRWYQQQIQTNK